jgi:hypothetical protein
MISYLLDITLALALTQPVLLAVAPQRFHIVEDVTVKTIRAEYGPERSVWAGYDGLYNVQHMSESCARSQAPGCTQPRMTVAARLLSNTQEVQDVSR